MHCSINSSFDNLVGGYLQGEWNSQAEHLCGLEVDHQFKLSWLNYWQIGGSFALENPAYIVANLTIQIGQAVSITHQASSRREAAKVVDRRYPRMNRQRDNLIALVSEKLIRANKESTGSLLDKGYEGRVEIVFGAGPHDI
jgi:hypothetical protein